jgi:hypothetical protein
MEVTKKARWDFVSEVKWPMHLVAANALSIEPLPLASRREVRAVFGIRRNPDRRSASRAADRLGSIDHAAQNIVDWSSYLPPECVKRMVALGWHQST